MLTFMWTLSIRSLRVGGSAMGAFTKVGKSHTPACKTAKPSVVVLASLVAAFFPTVAGIATTGLPGAVDTRFGHTGSISRSGAPLAAARYGSNIYVARGQANLAMSVYAVTSAGRDSSAFGNAGAYAVATAGQVVLKATSRGLVAISGRGSGDGPGVGFAYLTFSGVADPAVTASSRGALTRVGPGQIFWSDLGYAMGRVDNVLVQGAVRLPDGSVRVCIDRYFSATGERHVSLLGLTPTGGLDSRVGPGGLRSIPSVASCRGLGQDSSQRLYMTGTSTAGDASAVITRTNRDGLLDRTYGTAGSVRVSIPGASLTPISNLASTASSGLTFVPMSMTRFGRKVEGVIVRVEGAGLWDRSFGSQGISTVPGSATQISSEIGSLDFAPSARLVVGAATTSLSSKRTFLWRLDEATGVTDKSFGTAGLVMTKSWTIAALPVTATRLIQVGAVPLDGQSHTATRLVGRYN